MADTPHPSHEFIHITHPDVDAVGGPVTREAFENDHKPKGWKEAAAADVPLTAPPIPASPAAAAPTPKTTTPKTTTPQKGA